MKNKITPIIKIAKIIIYITQYNHISLLHPDKNKELKQTDTKAKTKANQIAFSQLSQFLLKCSINNMS